jgi:hypothetical protein
MIGQPTNVMLADQSAAEDQPKPHWLNKRENFLGTARLERETLRKGLAV